jgi:hypothetical protein
LRGEPRAASEAEALVNAAKFTAIRSLKEWSHDRPDNVNNHMIFKRYFLIILFGNCLLRANAANR